MEATLLPLSDWSVCLAGDADFPGWRAAARRLVLQRVPPDRVDWTVGGISRLPPASRDGDEFKVPRDFVERAEIVICHADPERFSLLYRLLWRLLEQQALMRIATDSDVRRFEAMEKSVRREIHKMRAFVRFRQVGEAANRQYVAWFEPQHFIVERNAPFFVRRFAGMRWTILTPLRSAAWDGERLVFGPGADRRSRPSADAAEALWLTYFRNIFNPARVNARAMQAEMPKRYWRNLPEASLIPGMIEGAEKTARAMVARPPTAPAPHHAAVRARHWAVRQSPDAGEQVDYPSIEQAREAARHCRRCPLWQDATQTVFGEGPADARIVFVGEQPGDREDLEGRPFVGPAGEVFDAALEEAGIDRLKVYVTNAVKHFKFEPRGKRRIHSRPNAGEIKACRWWLDKELDLLKPEIVVALGATAAQSLLGRAVPVTRTRGQTVEREDGLPVLVTIHPSFILRIRERADSEAERLRFVADMRSLRELLK